MKIRTSFVSNSSSASFILDKRYLNSEQTRFIIEYFASPELNDDGWKVTIDNDFIKGYTTMDNGSFQKILNELNVGMKAIVKYEGDSVCFGEDVEEPVQESFGEKDYLFKDLLNSINHIKDQTVTTDDKLKQIKNLVSNMDCECYQFDELSGISCERCEILKIIRL